MNRNQEAVPEVVRTKTIHTSEDRQNQDTIPMPMFDVMLRIKEVEMFDSLEELKSSWSVNGKNFPNFEKLDAKITSALNKIIKNS